jgi:TolB protein
MTCTRARLASAAFAALALVTPVTAASPAVAGSTVLGPNQVTMGDRVPWGRVGHGWYLTLIGQGPHGEYGIEADHQLLDLVDPLGGRYQMAKTAVGKDGSGVRRLVDWSADGRTALELVDPDSRTQRAVLYDLPAGTHRTIHLGRRVSGVRLGPHGSLYETEYAGRHGEPLLRRDADGTVQVLRRHTDGRPLTTPSTHRVVIGTNARRDHRLLVVGGHGRSIASLTTPGKCQAVRWWAPGVVVASCSSHHTMRLYAAPVDGSPGHWLTAYHGKHSADLGDLDVRRLHGTTYIEASGPCGVVFLARQHRDGTATEVHVPSATENVYLLGRRGDRLVLEMGVSCDGGVSRDAITHFDPRTGDNRIVALLPENEAYSTILGFDERRAPFA